VLGPFSASNLTHLTVDVSGAYDAMSHSKAARAVKWTSSCVVPPAGAFDHRVLSMVEEKSGMNGREQQTVLVGVFPAVRVQDFIAGARRPPLPSPGTVVADNQQ
jgi:hypothetical protein